MTISASGMTVDACFGENVRRLRQVREISMRSLYGKTGVSPSVISRIEHGHGTSLRNAVLIADGLGSSLGEMCSPAFLDRSVRALTSAVPVDMSMIRGTLSQHEGKPAS